jgi:hypothetical protein
MEGKSSRNQEILPIAVFKDRAISLNAAPQPAGASLAGQSSNQPIIPIAVVHGIAQPVKEQAATATVANERVQILIDIDIAPYFPTAESVNDALRALVTIARRNGKTGTSS